MYNLKLALSILHPGPFQLITVTSNVLMTYNVDNFYSLYESYNSELEFMTSYLQLK